MSKSGQRPSRADVGGQRIATPSKQKASAAGPAAKASKTGEPSSNKQGKKKG